MSTAAQFFLPEEEGSSPSFFLFPSPMVLKPVRTQPPFTRTGRYSWRDRPEVHRLEFLPEPGIRVRHAGKKRRMTDNTVRALEQREQFLYPHKKEGFCKPSKVNRPRAEACPTRHRCSSGKKGFKRHCRSMPEVAKALLGDLQEPLVRHDASGETQKLGLGTAASERSGRTVIWQFNWQWNSRHSVLPWANGGFPDLKF